MTQEHNELFAKHAIQLKLLAPAQVMACREVLAELESAGVSKLLAVVAVDQGALSRADAARLVGAINAKFPGKHPPLPGPAEDLEPAAQEPPPAADIPTQTRPAPAPRKAGPAPARPPAPRTEAAARRTSGASASARTPSASRSSSRPAAPSPAAKTNARLFMLLGGAAAVVVIAVIAVVAMAGKKKEPPVEIAKTPPAPVALLKPPPPPPREDPAPRPPDAKPEPKAEVKPPPPPPPPKDDAKKDLEEYLADRRKEGQAALDEVKRQLAKEKMEADQIAETILKRLAGLKVSLALISGETYKDAVIKSYTFHGAVLDVGGKETRITWDTIQPASQVAVAEVMFDPARAQEQFDRGRFFIARRMWKEARGAFAAAAKLGQGFENRVLEFSEVLDRLVSGQGGFRGSARRTGRDSVHLTWDFHEAKQLEDFTGGLSLAGKAVTLESPRKLSVFFMGGTSSGSDDSPLAFLGSLTASLKLSCDGPVSFHLFAGAEGGYEIELGPAGAQLFKIDPRAAEKDQRKPMARSEKVKLPAGKTCDVSLTVKYPQFTVTIDKSEALAFSDPAATVTGDPPKGSFGFGIPKGKLRIEAPFELEGRTEAAELDRRISDTEVMVRRALDPDLELIERFRQLRKALDLRGETPEIGNSADHRYFLDRLQPDYNAYRTLLENMGGVQDKQTPEQWKAELDALIAKHPEVPSMYHLRALFKSAHQDNIGALADLRKAVELFPQFHEALALQATILFHQMDAAPALEAIQRALEARPDFVQGYVIRAQCAYATSLSMQAFMDDLDIARKLDPQDGNAVTVQRMLKYQRLGPRELGCRFDYETPHYQVTTDISAEAAKRYGDNLEAAYRHYSSTFKVPGLRSGSKPRVSIFNTAENYYTYFELLSGDRGEYTLGVFRPSLNELVLFEKSSDLADTNHTLYHEAVHHFMTLMTNRTPPYWYNEGIAEYMGAIRIQDGKVVETAHILRDRLPYMQKALDVKSEMTFEKIMNETPAEFYYAGDRNIKYPQAWSMIHFFFEFEKGKYRPLIEKYFELLREGRTPRECFDTVFKEKAETLQKEWREFTIRLK
jgi:tetratricopeptide (TPR) repeat protein